MILVGLILLGAMTLWFGVLFVRSEKSAEWPVRGILGLLIIVASEFLLWRKVYLVEIYFTPLAWTGYILWIDAAVVRLTGHSRLRDAPLHFSWLALWSIPLWLIFEAYNLHLKNWAYLNLPHDVLLRYLGYGWSFATIWPALFETTDLFDALKIFHCRDADPVRTPSSSLLRGSLAAGIVLLVIPLVVPQPAASYLFGSVWLGMIFAVDPVNYWLGRRSLWREWLTGNRQGIYTMLLAGLFCGFLWEFWNYWALARWVYVFPMMQDLKIFEMPLIGFLGFPPFCVECFVMFELVNFGGLRPSRGTN